MATSSDKHDRNLSQAAAVEKIRQLARSARVCLFGTFHGGLPLTVNPMVVQDVDDRGNLWFLSGRSSLRNLHIARDPRVQLFFANPPESEYISLLGTATISDRRDLREKYWSHAARDWFRGGVDDPELTVLRVQATDGHYWDTDHGRAATILQIAAAAVTGRAADVGVGGALKP